MRICIETFACALSFIGELFEPVKKQFKNKYHYRTVKTVALTVFLSNEI